MTNAPLQLSIKRTSLGTSVYETLLEAMLAGRLPPGMELNSVALSQQLEVSRTPVKEALRLLAHDGLIEQVNNHKARVVRFTRQDVVEIYEVRQSLEAAAAEKAARLMDDATLGQLRAEANLVQRGQNKLGWENQALEFDLHFHDTLTSCCGNRRLQQEIARYRRLVRGFCRIVGRREILQQAFAEHLEILAAVESRKPAAAR